jgi:hypothetical protein
LRLKAFAELVRADEREQALAAPVQDDYKTAYIEAMVASNEAGFAGLSAAETIRELDRMVSAQPAPVQEPPPECQTEAEKRAYAFGWWKALEAQRALDKKAENARELGLDYEPAPVQEPVVFFRCNGCGHAYEQVHPTSCDCMEAGGFDRVEYYTTPPAAQRQWVGLTDEEIREVNAKVSQIPPIDYTTTTYARAIEAKLKEKNT